MAFDPRLLTLIAISAESDKFPEGLLQWALAVERGGATCVQLRAKSASSRALLEAARALVSALRIPLIVNDRPDIAVIAGAAGVHLGADDLPVERVRALAPEGFMIGASVGNDDELAGARGADYVGVGPVFGSSSKADAGGAIGTSEMGRLIRASGLPGVGVGGITPGNAAQVFAAGASGVAVLSAVADAPESAARALASASGR